MTVGNKRADAVSAADAVALFVSPRPLRLPIRSSFTDDLLSGFLAQASDEDDSGEAEPVVDGPTEPEPVVADAAGTGDGDAVTEVAFETRLACTASRVIDALENVLALKRDQLPLRVAVVVSAWDSVDPSMTPEKWVQQRLPALSSFLNVNSARVTSQIFGVSAQGGRLPQEKEALLAKGDVLDRVFAKNRVGESIAFAGPLRWTVEG